MLYKPKDREPLFVWIDRKEAKVIRSACKRAGITKSQWVRLLITEKLAKGKP